MVKTKSKDPAGALVAVHPCSGNPPPVTQRTSVSKVLATCHTSCSLSIFSFSSLSIKVRGQPYLLRRVRRKLRPLLVSPHGAPDGEGSGHTWIVDLLVFCQIFLLTGCCKGLSSAMTSAGWLCSIQPLPMEPSGITGCRKDSCL